MHILSCILTKVLQLPLPGAEEKFIEEASGSCSQWSGAEAQYSIISSHQPTIWCPFPNQICFIQFRACYLPLLYLSTNQNKMDNGLKEMEFYCYLHTGAFITNLSLYLVFLLYTFRPQKVFSSASCLFGEWRDV